ncbi:MAG: COX15/CtaA family protein [Candidatus Eiseniibacteriota bacterium]
MHREAHSVAARLGLATALLMFALIVIGAAVRATGSGLSCPDWPLCQGRLIPPFEFHVLIEWFHRLLALMVGLMLLATALWVWTHAETRPRLGALAALSIVLYLTQALLGALTVWKLLSPAMVSSHLAVGTLLFATLLTLGLIARAESELREERWEPRPAGLVPLAALATLWCWGQIVLGGMVSSTHAGLACPDWPTCYGRWLPPWDGPAALQMTHRFSAYGLFIVMLLTALRARHAADPHVSASASMALGQTAFQMLLGIANVMLGTPVWLSVLHLGTAAAILALSVFTWFGASRLPVPRAELRVAEAG